MRTGSGSRARRPLGWTLAALTVVVALGACAGVPTSGPIEQGPVVDSGESTQFVRVIAAPPSAGAEPAEIVRGFLEANASLEQDHAIARRYLTAPAAATWEPTASTVVYDPTSLVISAHKDQVQVSYDVVARLQADGSLVTLDPPVSDTITFTLEQVTEGEATVPQWRISDPPDGILISTTDLRRAYRLHEAYFLSSRGDLLVPDGRLLPVVGPSLPTALAEAVLAGPSAWLAPGVADTLPEGISLALGAVPVTDGVASVELSEQALAANDQQRQALAAQLTWTLTQLAGVSAVELRVNGDPYSVPGAPAVMDRTVWGSLSPDGTTGTDPAPYFLLIGSNVVRVNASGRTSFPIEADSAADLGHLAVSLDEKRAAAIEPGGDALWLLPLDRTTTTHEVEGSEITSVSFDIDGQAWFAEAGRIRRVGSAGVVSDVPITTEGIGPVSGLALARDGTRIALVINGTVFVGVLSQDVGQFSVVSVQRVDTALSDVVDVSWRDSTTLDVLGSMAGGARQVLRVVVGSGETVGLGAPADPAEVAGFPGATTLVGTEDGWIYGNIGLQWRQRDAGRSVAYPG